MNYLHACTIYFSFTFFSCLCLAASAQPVSEVPHILVVIAHPDDESTFSATLYKIAKEHHGIVDLFTITNGEAGYKYSTLAENYYGIELTDEKTGRSNLPRIRKKELMNAGSILGIDQYFFLDQKDSHYGLDEKNPLDTTWDVITVKKRLNQVLTNTHYDFLFCLLPEPGTHGQHKAATILALDAVRELPPNNRPIVLGAITRNKTDSIFKFTQYADYIETHTITDTSSFRIDRTASFSYKNRINYKVIVNWEIAEHKSQGMTQMSMNDGDYEEFWCFTINNEASMQKCAKLFNDLKITPYVTKTY